MSLSQFQKCEHCGKACEPWQRYCGAACCAEAEMHEPPAAPVACPQTADDVAKMYDAAEARWSEARDALSDFVPDAEPETIANFAAYLDEVKAAARDAGHAAGRAAALEEASHRFEPNAQYSGAEVLLRVSPTEYVAMTSFCGSDNDENEEELREQRNALRLENAELVATVVKMNDDAQALAHSMGTRLAVAITALRDIVAYRGEHSRAHNVARDCLAEIAKLEGAGGAGE